MTTATPIFPQTIVNSPTTINNASGTSAVTLYTAPAAGARIDKLILTSTDTSARDLQLAVSGNLIGTVSVPIGAGNTSGVAAKDAFADPNIVLPVDAFGNKVLYLANGQTLQAIMPVAVTAAKAIVATPLGGSF
jgi:hypothetical protein